MSDTTITPRAAAYQQAHPGPIVAWRYLLWVQAQWRAYHEAHRRDGAHQAKASHDCHDCKAANLNGRFDAWCLSATERAA